MGLIDLASANSLWRGWDYYKSKKVESFEAITDLSYSGIVSGSGENHYSVLIDEQHPRKSTCTCPFAAGRRVVCKHMIALHFTVMPDEAAEFQKNIEEWEAEEAEREEREMERAQERFEELKRYVNSLSEEQLRDRLLCTLLQLEHHIYWDDECGEDGEYWK